MAAVILSLTVQSRQRRTTSAPSVNGRHHPELISEEQSLSVLLRTLNYLGEERATNYILQKQLGHPEEILSLVKVYAAATQKWDLAASRLKDQAWPNPDAATVAELRDLQRQKSLLLQELVDRLPSQARSHLESVKRSMQLHSSSRPGGH